MKTDGRGWGRWSGNGMRAVRPSLFIGAVCLFCALGGVSACKSVPTGLLAKPVGAYDRPYPRMMEQTEVIDVQVIRDPETVISMTNTTSRTFGPSTVWINGRYNRPIPGFAPGQTLRMDLYEFRDEFGEKFRAGGFFATKNPDKVVHAQLETVADEGTELLGLVVVGQDE